MLKNLLRLALFFYVGASVALLGIRIWDVRFGGDVLFSYPPEWNWPTALLYAAFPGIVIAVGLWVQFVDRLVPPEVSLAPARTRRPESRRPPPAP